MPCTYLCGNSLGLQPKRTSARIKQYLDTWGAQGVQGHFKPLEDSPLPTWLDADAHAAKMMAPVVGADESEVAVMQTLTANLHLLMTAFYRPDPKGRHKIILESKAFPSDHVCPPRGNGLFPLPLSSLPLSLSLQMQQRKWLIRLSVRGDQPDPAPRAVAGDVDGDA